MGSEVVHPENVHHPPSPRRDRFAALLAKKASSVSFLGANLVVWTAWVVTGGAGVDPRPYQLLTLLLSFEAIVLTIAVLIGQRLDAEKQEREAEADLKNDAIAAEAGEKSRKQLDRIERKLS